MMDEKLSDILAKCLDAIENEEATIEECLIRYSDHRDELDGLLETFYMIQEIPTVSPSQKFNQIARTRLENRLSSRQSHVTFPKPFRHIIQRTFIRYQRRFSMKWLVSLAIVAALFVGGTGVAYASADALPGDMLYGAKSAIQNVQLALSGDDGDINLLLGFMNKHLNEVGELINQGRFGDVDEGIGMYQQKLAQLLQTRERVSSEDAHAEDALTQRMQQELRAQTQTMQQFQERVKDQQKVQEKLQETIRQAENGAGHGPGEGGPPEESGGPSGAGPGEPQGEQGQNQNQTGQSEDPPGPNEEPGNGEPEMEMEGECGPWEKGEGEAGESGCGPGGGEDDWNGSGMPRKGHGGR